MEQERLIQLFEKMQGTTPAKVEALPGAGSNRRYYRLCGTDGTTCIGVIGTSAEENRAFYNLSLSFSARHLPVPAVIAHTSDFMVYLQEDLGSTSLFDYLHEGRSRGGTYSEQEEEMLHKVIRLLPTFQFEGGGKDVFTQCYPQAELDHTSVMFDLNYFKYCFLKLRKLEFNEYSLQTDFERLAADLLLEDADTFLYRDFQARNVMLRPDGSPCFIDYQGGRRGPIYYDLASFLWQASARYGDDLRQRLIDTYWNNLQPYISGPDAPSAYQGLTLQHLCQRLRLFVLFRLLQVLGAYGYRGLWERKQHFIDSIPPALDNLRQQVALGTCDPYPYLKSIALSLTKDSPLPSAPTKGNAARQTSSSLIIRIFSFSYKKGIPDDPTGNGGGYVFDCRSSNNPGRYPEYRHLTGLDQPVIDFLEQDGEILQFLDHVLPLVEFHARRWLSRGFTSLQISFGCTGGQHRSVYCAQHTAEYLNRTLGVEVHLCHREQGISQHFTRNTLVNA